MKFPYGTRTDGCSCDLRRPDTSSSGPDFEWLLRCGAHYLYFLDPVLGFSIVTRRCHASFSLCSPLRLVEVTTYV